MKQAVRFRTERDIGCMPKMTPKIPMIIAKNR
jgi:hypothetical protein